MERAIASYATRIDGDRVGRAALRARTIAQTAWREPALRRLVLALAAAIISAVAFARVAEDYLTNDPLTRWDVSFARWLSGERSSAGTDFFRILTDIGSPAAALAIGTIVCVVLYRLRQSTPRSCRSCS